MLSIFARAAALGAVLLCAGMAHAEPIKIRTRMIEAFGGPPEAQGRLTFLGGLVMSGPADLGALSALLMDGDRMLAVSDTGFWFAARLVLAGGRPLAVEDAELVRRLDVNGRPIDAKQAGDAEALTRVDGGVLVGVERSAQLLRYPADGIRIAADHAPTRLETPLRMIQAARRHGFEALATGADGTVIAAAEGREWSGDALQAFRIGGAPFLIARRGDWSITGADTLPGGDMVIVERHYGGGIDVGMRVRRIGLWDLAEGRLVDGPVLLEADFASQIDNMEGVAATLEDGRVVLTFLSDDNLSMLQRTLVLRFALRDPVPRRRPDRTQTALWPDAAPSAERDLTAER